MIQWINRTPEIAYLLNPPFCSLIIYSTIFEYQKKTKDGLPFPLVYLILPIILHKDTRNRISSRTNMVVWLQHNPDVLVGFSDRAKSLLNFTGEAIEFLLFQNNCIVDNGRISISKTVSKSKIDQYVATDQEIMACIQKTTHLGQWFYNMRATENIYTAWGVKP